MKRILTGIQSTGVPHLGNLLGAILPALRVLRAAQQTKQLLCFIADLHTLTSQKDPVQRQEHTHATAAAWLACGLDPKQHIFYRQSNLPEVCELAWYLSCFTPFPMLANSHAFKDKADRLSDVNAGLFTYPVLMAADILLYDADLVPVGRDQQQHVEMARDIAQHVNHRYGQVFVVPEASFEEKVAIVPGTDGNKMSKSYNNTINVFAPQEELSRCIMGIPTDSTSMEAPKDPDTCCVFALYSLLAKPQDTADMRQKYLAGNYGYGMAKQALVELILDRFARERQRFDTYMQDWSLVDDLLIQGEAQARDMARSTLQRVRDALGYAVNT